MSAAGGRRSRGAQPTWYAERTVGATTRRRDAESGLTPDGRSRRSRALTWFAGGLSLAVFATIAVIASGYDARETPREEHAVWAMRQAGQYARVNTETGEIDTVRQVEQPSSLLQSGAHGTLLSHGGGRAWAIDAAQPRDLVDDRGAPGGEAEGVAQPDDATAPPADPGAAGSDPADPDAAGSEREDGMRTPDGTREALAAGEAVVFRTEAGEVLVSRYEEEPEHRGRPGTPAGVLGEPVRLALGGETDAERAGESAEGGDGDEAGDPIPARTRADAIALDDDGLLAVYVGEDATVRWFDATTGEVAGDADVIAGDPPAAQTEGLQLASVAGEWALLDAAGQRLWREGVPEPVALGVGPEARLQQSSVGGGDVLIADTTGLWAVGPEGEARRLQQASGTPARPVSIGDERYAAWLAPSGGELWRGDGSGAGETVALPRDPSAPEGGDPVPVFQSNGSRAVLGDVQTGMLWTVPDGRLIPLAQWSLVDPPKNDAGTVVVQDVVEQEPPVAVDDAFGVRPGEPTTLPVMLNDFDPNRRDVLTIVPDGLGDGLPDDFGRVELLPDAQALAFTPGPGAAGAASFTYRVTDGAEVSAPATVTLRAVDDGENTAPEWCPVDGCRLQWPAPEMAPGGTLLLPALEGWVDLEGDPILLIDAVPVNPDDPVRALITAEGRLAVRHTDPNAEEGDFAVRLTVGDVRGAQTERELWVHVTGDAELEFSPIATTVLVGEGATVRPLDRVSGGSGSYELVDASVQSGAVEVSVRRGGGALEVAAADPGGAVLSVAVRDLITGVETSGVVRVTAVDRRPDRGLPPLRAFVRQFADTTIEVFDAVPGAAARALSVQSVRVVDGELTADVIDHARVRVSGTTPSGEPGRIGAADIVISEGDGLAETRLTVFQAPEHAAGAVAVDDTATVRAGEVVDVAVLDNDVAPPGERLVLHPEIGATGLPGELAFASGKTLRYLAPEQPGSYTLTYTTYGASTPESSDVGRVRVEVLPADGNRPPEPETVVARVAPGERTTVQVPLSGVDPDGDRVRLVDVAAGESAEVSASMVPRNSAISVSAAEGAKAGAHTLGYTVRDSFGAESSGRLRVVVARSETSRTAPVAYSDYVRLVRGAADPAIVRPLENDVVPGEGRLELVSVEPNLAGGPESDAYAEAAARLDLSRLDEGRVLVAAGDRLGTVSYRYTLRAPDSSSTAEGLIVVQVSERVGVQAPTVLDTVLSARDRAEFARTGIDVVTDRVRWAGGDPSRLELSVWGDAAERYRVDGNRIIGEYLADGDMVPFRLTGPDSSGTEVAAYGFLVVPPLDELKLTLRAGLAPIRVDEGQSVDVALADVVESGVGEPVLLRQGGFAAQRGQADCRSTGEHSFRYTAGAGEPFSDTCVIEARLESQSTWTALPVPIAVVPDSPRVQLRDLSRTVQPGGSETVALTDMVRWEGGREGRVEDLRFEVSDPGGGVRVSRDGASLTLTARADARPLSQHAALVSVSGAGEATAQLTVAVGSAPRDAPRGATASQRCTVGDPCEVRVVGLADEYDPFAGQPGGGLELVSVEAVRCDVAGFSVRGDSLVVGWRDDRGAGGECTVPFTVRDAQGRTGGGALELDALGVPRAPASIRAASYTASSVVLEVELSGQRSHPGVTGVVIDRDGSRVGAGCSPSGGVFRCEVTGLRVGEQHRFSARAVNAVGESDPVASAVTAWAYDPPQAPDVFVAVQTSAESPSRGTVMLNIGSKAGTASNVVRVGDQEVRVDGTRGQIEVPNVATGESVRYSVTPLSEHPVPSGGDRRGNAATGSLRVGGLPEITSFSASSPQHTDEVRIEVQGRANHSQEFELGYAVDGACVPRYAETSGSYVAKGPKYRSVTVTACASNEWGDAPSRTAEVTVGQQIGRLEGKLDFTIGVTERKPTWVGIGLTDPPRPTVTDPQAVVQYRIDGQRPTARFQAPAQPGQVASARQCTNPEDERTCSPWAQLEGKGMPATGWVALNLQCVDPDAPERSVDFSPSLRDLGRTVTADGGRVTVDWGAGRTATLTGGTACPPPDPGPGAEADADADGADGGVDGGGVDGGADSDAEGGVDAGGADAGADGGADGDPDGGADAGAADAGADPGATADAGADAGTDPGVSGEADASGADSAADPGADAGAGADGGAGAGAEEQGGADPAPAAALHAADEVSAAARSRAPAEARSRARASRSRARAPMRPRTPRGPERAPARPRAPLSGLRAADAHPTPTRESEGTA